MPTKILVPEAGESVIEATVGEWLKKEGDRVKAGEALVELETDKVNLEVAAETSGVLAKIERQTGEDVQVGDVLGLIEEGEGDDIEPRPKKEKPSKAGAGAKEKPVEKEKAAEQPKATDGKATPVAKRVAAEHAVDLAQVSGSGRITRGDVEDYLQQQKQPPPPAPKTPGLSTPAAPERPETRQKMSRRRRTIAQRLLEAQHTTAMLTTFNEIDMSAVMNLRQRRQDDFVKRHNVKLGFMSFFTKAAIGALKAFPELNAEIDGDDIVTKHYFDIGIAVGAAEGLVVPVLRNADRMTFAQIETAIKDFGQRAQNNSLSLEDLRGGTFTITNGGVFGSLLSTPILNPPQVGILGLHKIEKRPVVVGDEIAIRPMMYVALSYDHRIVDGREAVQFLVRIKELMEDPEAMLLEG
ncbi:MAG: Dihydrolipoyllysine-residue succinyltransferase component of 2-oxoglutarate dehydrogenase complex [Anaerolineae bacterium]|nr:Dihydrolipoyllysine-residue succinyltransferase component of 2-oxoglutarate dehydrogenase complex [Anaerolineae bacterium]